MLSTRIEIDLPDWLVRRAAEPRDFTSLEQRMAFAIDIAEQNAAQGSGGPFGAAVFDRRTRALLSVGANLVVGSQCSAAHAEMLALALAQRARGHFDLAADGAAFELVTSAEPCTMCLGACCWSGIRRVVCAARGEDAESIGFDEGPKPANWPAELSIRGIEVVRDVLRERARSVLHDYGDAGGPIYNAHR